MFQAEENLADTTIVKLTKIFNENTIDVKLPENSKLIKKAAASSSDIEEPTIYVFCEKCGQPVLNKTKCSLCKIITEKIQKPTTF